MKLLPWWIKLLVLAGVALLLVALVRYYHEMLRDEGRQEVRAQWSEVVRIAQRAEDHRAAERRKKEKEADDATAAALTRLAADAAGARRSADKLQRRADELLDAARRQQAACGSAGAATPGQPGSDPAGMLAHMRSRLDEAAGRIGGYATRLLIAGAGCEARFDAVTDTQLSPSAGAGPASPGSP